MEKFETVKLPADAVLKTSWLATLSKKINAVPSLYLEAGAIHGCVLCEGDRPLLYMEDVGRHNAVDKIRSEEHTSELQSLMRISYAVFCLKKKKRNTKARKQ